MRRSSDCRKCGLKKQYNTGLALPLQMIHDSLTGIVKSAHTSLPRQTKTKGYPNNSIFLWGAEGGEWRNSTSVCLE